MTLKYYFKNLLFGLLCLISSYIIWRDNRGPVFLGILAASVISFLVFPFAKKAMENVALYLVPEDFWHKGVFIDIPQKSTLYIFYYILCFAIAVPVGLIYILHLLLKKGHPEDDL